VPIQSWPLVAATSNRPRRHLPTPQQHRPHNFSSTAPNHPNDPSASPKALDKRYYEPDSRNGIRGDAELILDPELQELSALPCDTYSERAVLEKEFPGLAFGILEEGRNGKEGVYGADEEAA